MPLSEHEQRMLEEIENALYAEDPKFASSVKSRRLGKADGRRRLQAFAVFVIGLVLLVGGLAIGLKVGGFPIVSLIGFLVMFGGGLLALWGGGPPSRGLQRRPRVRVRVPEGRGRELRPSGACPIVWRSASTGASSRCAPTT